MLSGQGIGKDWLDKLRDHCHQGVMAGDRASTRTARCLQGPPIPPPSSLPQPAPSSPTRSRLIFTDLSHLIRKGWCDLEVLAGGGKECLGSPYHVCSIIHRLVTSPTCCYFVLNTSLFVFETFYFAVIVDSHAVVRNDTEKSHVPITQFHPMLSCCKTVL